MPTVKAPAKVLVSGANGFIAVWVVNTLLEKGYAVRGTVRSLDKGDHLKKLFGKYGDRFELVVVEDIAKEGAFDEAVKGVDAIEHTASPFHFNADDPQELIDPAVNGTIGILKSAQKYGLRVKRIVVTSSTAAIVGTPSNPPVYTEADWGDKSIDEVNEKGKGASNGAKYRASKTLAEKAAWRFYEENKGSVNWDLVTLNPPYVFGPVIHAVSSPKALNTSVLHWYDTVVARTISSDQDGGSYVDVRDLGLVHVLALGSEEAVGERFIISAGAFVWKDWINVVDETDTREAKPPRFDASKGKKVFGIEYRTMEDTAKDMVEDFKTRGWEGVEKHGAQNKL